MNDINIDDITQWEKKYKPIANTIDSGASWTNDEGVGLLFETFGAEEDFVRQQPDNNVWTWVDGDGGTFIVTGMAFVNRIGYFVTTEPWETHVEIQVDVYGSTNVIEAIEELSKTFPKLQVGTDEDGLLVIFTNEVADESELYDHFLEVMSCTMDNCVSDE